MFALASLLTLITQVSGTPYISGGDSPAGTDCSGLASWIANTATGRPTFGDRFHTGNEWAALRARGFQDGTAPGALVIGWNGGHTAITLPDGTPVSSGEGGGVRIGGGGAYQRQFTHHMYLPMPADSSTVENPDAMVPVDLAAGDPQLPPPAAPEPAPVMDVAAQLPAPEPAPVVDVAAELPAPDGPQIVDAANTMLPPPPMDPALPGDDNTAI